MSETSPKTLNFRGLKFWRIFLAGFLWGIVFCFVFGIIYLRHGILREYRSKFGYEETLAELKLATESRDGWVVRVGAACSMPKLEGAARLEVLKLCHGKYAREMLNDENGRRVAAVIPCTIAVYEKESDGRTYISRLDVGLLGILLGGVPGRLFPGNIQPDHEAILAAVLE